jgi:hypothetical protein
MKNEMGNKASFYRGTSNIGDNDLQLMLNEI